MYFLRNKIVKAFLILFAVVTLLASFSHFAKGTVVAGALNTVFAPIYSAADKVISPARQFIRYVKKAPEYEKTIETLKNEINALKIENKSRSDYVRENKRLKELLDLKDSMSGFDTVSARVVSYEPNSWYDTVMLNKGASDGISKNDVVVTSLGVVGKVIDVGANWTKVSTVLNISNSVGVRLARTGDIGVVSGDANLAENKKCRLEYLSNDKNLIKGDILVTSGLGGIYPSDLTIGKVTEICSDSAKNLEYGVVEPSVDFSSLYEVLVITYGTAANE